jgi:hypothetical protein
VHAFQERSDASIVLAPKVVCNYGIVSSPYDVAIQVSYMKETQRESLLRLACLPSSPLTGGLDQVGKCLIVTKRCYFQKVFE